MADVTVSVRVEKQLHDQMRLHEEINWSAVLRNSIAQKLEDVTSIDTKRAQEATALLRGLLRRKAFDHGRPTGELIREWRDKRR